MLTTINDADSNEEAIGVVQAGVVLPFDIELLQETFTDKKQEFNRLLGSKDHYYYETGPATGTMYVSWGRSADWGPARRNLIEILPQQQLKIETWPSIPELVRLASRSFPQLNESNFKKMYKSSQELRDFLAKNVPFTIIFVKGFRGSDKDQILRLKINLYSMAYVVTKNNYVYKLYEPKNIWIKLRKSIELMESGDWKYLFKEKYRETLEKIEAHTMI